ncbi:MAG: ACT domain-containing protein, partial [Planctomycetaceae bacterium]|nr:ACT domain-containing protein [Planctomycetaceae bacterium]
DAFEFCQRHGLSEFDSQLVSWLVENHLLMSFTAQQSDISDMNVIEEFVGKVKTSLRLNYIYLLTVSDIRGTNPGLWNSWRASLLNSLYSTSRKWLRESDTNSLQSSQISIDAMKQSALSMLAGRDVNIEAAEQFWKQLEPDYFLRHTDDEIAWHVQTIINADHAGTLVKIRPQTARGCTEIFIYSRDRTYLFHNITNGLSQLGLDVLDARIITSTNGFALDTFLVLGPNGKPLQDKKECEQIEAYLAEMIEHPDSSLHSLGHRHIPRRLTHFQTSPKIQFKECGYDNFTLLEVDTTDFPGLLAAITQVLAKNNIQVHNARVSTLGERAYDIFYVTDSQDQRIDDPQKRAVLAQQLGQAITNRHSEQSSELVF